MSEIAYTMIAGDGKVLARGVTLPRALVLALEHGGGGKPALVYSDIGHFRCFALGWRAPDGGPFRSAANAIVPRTDSHGFDSDRAFDVFEQVLLNYPGEIWDGRVVPDEDYAAPRSPHASTPAP